MSIKIQQGKNLSIIFADKDKGINQSIALGQLQAEGQLTLRFDGNKVFVTNGVGPTKQYSLKEAPFSNGFNAGLSAGPNSQIEVTKFSVSVPSDSEWAVEPTAVPTDTPKPKATDTPKPSQPTSTPKAENTPGPVYKTPTKVIGAQLYDDGSDGAKDGKVGIKGGGAVLQGLGVEVLGFDGDWVLVALKMSFDPWPQVWVRKSNIHKLYKLEEPYFP